jgi:4-amino-4-deoxy-L-arabinose transferase-like glycosyltransferase
MEGHGGNLLFYVPVLLVGFFPWSAFLPSVLYHALRRWKSYWQKLGDTSQEQHLELFLSLWVAGLMLFFTLSATRLPHYIYPAFPASAVLVALWWKRLLNGESSVGVPNSTRILIGVGYLVGIAVMFVPAVFQAFLKDIAREFPGAVQLELGWLPMMIGLVILIGTMGLRQCMISESTRHLGVWVGGLMMVVVAALAVRFGLPMYQQYFIGPPQELAGIARYNLGTEDRLIQVGRKRPSLGFYAQRKVYFVGPRDEELVQHLSAPGRKMVILQTPLRQELPDAMSDWTLVLDHHGFSLLSSEPLL